MRGNIGNFKEDMFVLLNLILIEDKKLYQNKDPRKKKIESNIKLVLRFGFQ